RVPDEAERLVRRREALHLPPLVRVHLRELAAQLDGPGAEGGRALEVLRGVREVAREVLDRPQGLEVVPRVGEALEPAQRLRAGPAAVPALEEAYDKLEVELRQVG